MVLIKEKIERMIHELREMGYSLDESNKKIKEDIVKCEKEIEEYYEWIESKIDIWIDGQIDSDLLNKHGVIHD